MTSRRPGELAIVLHTHMPYVEGFGTWPFGEEWLWEAIATSYLPLLDVLGRAPLTLSLTPVLCDQLEAPGASDRCLQFLTEIRPESHRRDINAFTERGELEVAAELERSGRDYATAAERLAELPTGLLGALGEHATWTSAATHAVLPLLASDAGIALQVHTGIESHRRRFGSWSGGFWLPECAYAPWIVPLLEEAGVRAACVELPGGERSLRPLASDEGVILWPIDRDVISLVWSERGYPAGPAYRSYHGLTDHHHRVWRNDGGVYDRAAADAAVASDARDFVARSAQRLADGGLCICALDTELLGHWWFEGVAWLRAVIDESARAGLALTTLDDALERHEPVSAPGDLGVSSWGEGCDLRTWSGPQVAELAWGARTAELRTLVQGAKAPERALRELLALQSSDWAFMVWRKQAGEYPRDRAAQHASNLERALAGDDALQPDLRSLAPELVGWPG